MTEETKNRMEDWISDYRENKGGIRSHLKDAYEAGMQDPDANAEILEECEKQIRHSYNCDYHVRRYDRDCTCGASAVIEKLKAARG